MAKHKQSQTGSFLHQLLSLPEVFGAHLSPDGRWVAFEWYRIHENLDVFLVPTDGLFPPLPLTHTLEYTNLVSWTLDSRAVVVAEDHDRDEFARLFRVDVSSPGEMQPLTEDRPSYLSGAGVCTWTGARSSTGPTTTLPPGRCSNQPGSTATT